MNSIQIRQTFLDFFSEKQHQVVPSAPMVVKDDPTLMFINAGMNQFKDLFLGNSKVSQSRVTDSQKCLRVSGKHNDLEEVGVDTYHHTMFEMLGNWSFGDPTNPSAGYFKKEAIEWAWELLVDVYKIDKTKLYFTVFEGNDKDGTSLDQESYDIWKAILEKNDLTEKQILKCDKKDNFWEMGDTGPCGPCSEIHIDIRSNEDIAKLSGRDLVNQDHPQVIEIWNLVFMEFNRMADGKLKNLPAKHVDTGMGFERLAMVLQNKKSNYDTDIFSPLTNKISEISGVKYQNTLDTSVKTDVAIRVISDHVRAVAFSIADGQLPSNSGAGYVIRRILRRGIRYGYSFLNIKEPFIYLLVDVLILQLEATFPELKLQQSIITKVIKEEEESFLRTLSKGINRFDKYLATANDKMIDGKFAFELYDTFGFPIDLTSLLAHENHFHVNMPGFSDELLKQKERSRAAGKIETTDWIVLRNDDVEEFVGYDYSEAEVFIIRYRKVIAKGEEQYQLVFNLTPFYPEGGGQIGDIGFITANGKETLITDTKKENNIIVHFVSQLPENVDATFKAIVNEKNRNLVACNHTATHLLHQALREVLGVHVEQKGSLVNADYLRFDFTHFEKVNPSEIEEISKLVNQRIQEQFKLEEHRTIPIAMAKEKGAIMLFGEKYGDVVRMIQFGESKELCGGIHVKNTEEIELFKIKSEGSVASGIRRIEALTSEGAGAWLKHKIETIDKHLHNIASPELDKTINKVKEELLSHANLVSGFEILDTYTEKTDEVKISAINNIISDFTKIKIDPKIIQELSLLKKEFENHQKDSIKEEVELVKKKLIESIEVIENINVLAQKITLTDSAAIKDLAFQLKNQIPNLFLILGAEVNEKPNLTIVVSENLVKEKSLHAGNIIREAAKAMQGGGGGQPFFATAGGKNLAGIDDAIKKAKSFLV